MSRNKFRCYRCRKAFKEGDRIIPFVSMGCKEVSHVTCEPSGELYMQGTFVAGGLDVQDSGQITYMETGERLDKEE